MKVSEFINKTTQPKFFIKVVIIIILIFLAIMITDGLIKYGFSRALYNEVLVPTFGITGMVVVIAIFGIFYVLIAGKIKSYWYYLIIGGILNIGYCGWDFFSNKTVEQKTDNQSLIFAVLLNLVFIYLVFRQLYGKTKAIEGLVYERDEREKALTAQAAKNASLVTIILLIIVGVTFAQFSNYSLSGYRIGYIINSIISVFFIVFAGSLLKYKLY